MSEEISNVHILALQDQIRKNLAFRDNLLREKSVDDLWVFNRYILDVERGKKPLGEFQKQLCRFIEEEKTVKKLGLLPRGHLKTTLATIGYSTQQIVKNQNIRILLLNGTWQLAVDSLAEVKRHLQTNPNILRIWGDLTVGNSEWSQDRITLARSNTNIKGPTVWAAGIESNLIGSHPDIIIMDDVVTRENTETIEQIDKVKLRYKDALDLLEPGGQLIIIGCLTRESKVLMGNGSWKEIDQVKAGDIVFSHKDKKLVKRKVEALIPQGKARVFSVKTARHQIKATDRHPFLTINAENETHWKRVQQLQAGEKVLTIAQVPIETSKRFYDGSLLRKEDFYLLGYLWGDGWLTNNKPKGIVGFCVAKGVNDTFLPILKKWAPNYKETAYGYYRIQNTKIGKWLQKNGFSSGAKIKRIPQWIFEARTSYRKAFIDGLLAADGCKQKKGYEERIELANKGLIEDLYWLSLTSGYRPTTIFHRQRMIQAPHSKEESLHDFWSLGLVVSHHQSWGENQYTWRWDRITSIQEEGEEEVFDLTIEETANFIANGYVVHNTRYTYNDFYSWIIEKNEKHNNFRMMIKRAFIGDMHTGQDFQALWPEKFSREELLERLQEKGPYEFFSQYCNEPTSAEDADFKREWFKYYDPEEYRGAKMNTVMTIDPAISEKKSADYTAIGVFAADQWQNHFVKDLYRGHWKVDKIVEAIFYVYALHHPQAIILETIAYQKALAYILQLEMQKRGIYLPIIEKQYHDRSKDERIRALQPLYAAGKVFHQKAISLTRNFEEELLQFPRGAHDDLIDTFAMSLDYLVPPTRHHAKRYQQKYLY